MNAAQHNFYQTGGTLPPDAPSYIERAADGELRDALLAGEFCYLLDTRQVGKSSMLVRAAARLRAQGLDVALLDLTRYGKPDTLEQWLYSLLDDLGEQLDLTDELDTFWQEHRNLGPLYRWMEALRFSLTPPAPSPEQVRAEGERSIEGESRLIIFVDEIDAVRALPFSTDEFFAGIRACYNRRAEDPEMRRLTFCLAGSATPDSLIQDVHTTPFNIGRGITLTDFTEAEARPLVEGLNHGEHGGNGETEKRERPGSSLIPHTSALLKRILYWTGGHPYLTQRLCQAIAETLSNPTLDTQHPIPVLIDCLCEAMFFAKEAREREANLSFVASRLLKSGEDIANLLDLYARACVPTAKA